MNEIVLFLSENSIGYEENVLLKERTWIRRGGKVGVWIEPRSIDELTLVCRRLYQGGHKFDVIGHTSNLYFKNTYSPDVVICTKYLTGTIVANDKIKCECGVKISALARMCVEAGYCGYEGLVDLPGTVASAAHNNSGCYQCGVEQLLLSLELLSPDGSIRKLSLRDMRYSERSSALKRGELSGVILRVFLTARDGDQRLLQEQAQRNHLHRKTFQNPPAKNLGSVFPARVVQEFYRNLPRGVALSCRMIALASRRLGIPRVLANRFKHKLLLRSLGAPELLPYISDFNFNCFLWVDEQADQMFEQYVELIRHVSGIDDIEVEVRG